jgi:mannose-6-phosphate isomerase-like protein (cupin superfamily)
VRTRELDGHTPTPGSSRGKTRKEDHLNAGPEEKGQQERPVQIVDLNDPARGDDANELQGYRLGAGISLIVVDAPPGGGPRLHRHPYEEVFVVLEGTATFTAGDDTIEVRGGQVVVVPAGMAHKFVNSGPGRLRQVDIHAEGQFATEWLEA